MTPSNPSNGNPFAYNVQDAQGVKHQIVPVNHTHTLSEISDYPGSESTPTAGSSKLVTSGGVKTALDGKANQGAVDVKENKPYPLDLITGNDNDWSDLTPTDGQMWGEIIGQIETAIHSAYTANYIDPVHVRVAIWAIDSHDEKIYKVALEGAIAIMTHGSNVYLTLLVGNSIYKMDGTYVDNSEGCTVTMTDSNFWLYRSIG